MIITDKHVKGFHGEIFRRVKNKKRKCLFPNCNKTAIKSHVVWKSGILKRVAEAGHLMELNTQKNLRQEPTQFTKTGINDILSFKGFCNYHDNEMFKSIEKNDTNFNLIQNQALLSLRGILHEYRKKETTIQLINEILKSNLYPQQEDINYYKGLKHNNELGINDLSFYVNELCLEYVNPIGRFTYKTIELDEIPIVFSSFFMVDSWATMFDNSIHDIDWVTTPLNSIAASCFPDGEKSLLVLGFHTNYLQNLHVFKNINRYNTEQKLKLVSDIIIERIESWACSISFYEEHIKPIENKFLTAYDMKPTDFDGLLSDKINVFANYP